MMFIVYKTTHITTGRYYIGKCSRKQWERGYMGSGTWIKRMIAKHGREAFAREIISEHATEREAFGAEQLQIGMRYVLDLLCVNLRSGGDGGIVNKNQHRHTEEAKAKISAFQKNRARKRGIKRSPETRAKMSRAQKGNSKWKRRVMTDEYREKLSKANQKPFMLKGIRFACRKYAAIYFNVHIATIGRWKRKERENGKRS